MNLYYLAGLMVGALIATFLLSRLSLWLLKSWAGGVPKLGVAHALSLLLGSVIMSMNGSFTAGEALTTYLVPQAVWLAVDIIKLKRGRKIASAQQHA